AMDGYAVVSADTVGASARSPVRLRVVGDLPAGRVPAGAVRPGTAVRIMTGAPVPDGADAVVMVEDTTTAADEVSIRREARPGENVRDAGEDIRAGDLLLTPGTYLRPAHVGICAVAGRPDVLVYGVPTVAVVSTGDEVVDPGEPLLPGKIRNSNLYTLVAQVTEAGARVHSACHVPDEPEALRRALAAAAAADVVVTSGGVSVGDYDLVKEILAEEGQVEFWKVAMKPGKPMAFGRLRGKPMFGLPGNPVSSMVTFEVAVRPALRKMMGHLRLLRPEVSATLLAPLRHKPGRREFVRAVTTFGGGGCETRATGDQGSGILTSMLRANSLIIVPEEAADVPASETVTVALLE
ncbi:MAG: molybdopterin molybdotransferase MoeA, partial [Armatimonadetes bacterium]|nr:molybdopterin molybdotransferase MoeA [Armatimonadota bacterium]